MSALLPQDRRDGILRLTLNDPASRNSLSSAMMQALHQAIAEAQALPAVRVIVIAATGPAFCAGHNLKEIAAHRSDADQGRSFFTALMAQCTELFLSIVHCPKPVIAEVQATATAAGCQLVASCDLAIAADSATFATPGVNIGLFCSTPMVALSRNVSPKAAMAMLLTGEPVPAAEALRIGLINQVVSPNELAGAVDALAAKIASKSQITLKTGKQAFYRQLDLPLEEAYAYAAGVMVENLMQRDAEEGIAAFIAQRPPDWEDR